MAFVIDDQGFVLLNAPFDPKTCNYWVDGEDGDMGSFIIDSIPEYLVRVGLEYRTPEKIITILVPKLGTTPPVKCDNDATLINALLAFYDGKYYSFVGGVADINFVEKINSLAVAGREIGLISTTLTVVFPFTFNDVPIGEVKAFRYDLPYPGAPGMKRMEVLFYLADANWLTTSGFTIEIDSTESLTGIIVEYSFIQKSTIPLPS